MKKEDKDEHYTSIRLIGLKETVLKYSTMKPIKRRWQNLTTKNLQKKVSFKNMKDLLMHHNSSRSLGKRY